MKNKIKLFGIIAFVAVIGFSMASCSSLAGLVGVSVEPAATAPATAPATAEPYRGRNNETFTFQVTGASGGSVWGSGIYTDDSLIARAAVHAGVVAVGETKTVTIRILPGRDSYQGTTRNGVTTTNYARWHGSYEFVGASVDPAAPAPAPATAEQLRGRNNETFTFQVTGASGGSVWGSDVYTDDSLIARAAVHAGIVAVGETKTVTIRILPGRSSYQGTTRNGVTTANYASWHGSYEFVR